MTRQEAKQRIFKLRQAIEHHRYLYHVLDRQEISEAALDSLKHELYKLEQEFPELITPDSPTQRVGGEPLPAFVKVAHKTPMLSMEDVFTPEELREWLERIKRVYPRGQYDFYAEIKMDGLAVSLIYQDGVFVRGKTRGDGKVGEDVTQNLRTIEAIPLRLQKYAPGELEVRGEVYMTKKNFEILNREQKKKGEAPFANPRNASAGSIRQLDPRITAARRLSFYGYALLGAPGLQTHEQTHDQLKTLGIPVNSENERCKDLEEVVRYHDKIKKKREKLPYWTDGIVAVVNDDATFERLGVVGKAPRGMVAYKFPAEQSTTRVAEVRWQVGRTGVLTPVAVMDPVFVAGTTVRHATLHNMDEIERLGLKIGDTVILEKAGDIIPKIVKALPKLRTGHEKTIHAPTHCLVCGAKVKKAEGEVAIQCTNKNCPAKHHERLIHFVSRKAFDIDGLGEKIVKQLMDTGLLATPADIFKLEKSDLVDLERFADKSAENLIAAIAKAREITLPRFIYALGIKHVGEETAVDLAKKFGTLKKVRDATLEEFNAVPNIGEVVAQSLHEYFSDKHNQKLVDDLLAAGVRISNFEFRISRQTLKGLTFVLTGGLESMTRDEAKQKIRALGGDVGSSVSKNTNYVVTGSEPGDKYDKAKKLGVKTIDEKEFLRMLK
ncbi:NAD-dependent DNA ligase LigA [Candidatus Uhrbacteria bacterium]|nr:NAD-dependent DNA ligase LigA [Candidatus Uhrbacteria bacterium]